MTTIFIRALEAHVDDKDRVLQTSIQSLASGDPVSNAFSLDPELFFAVPTSPFSYWVSDGIRSVFQERPRVESNGRSVKQGLATADDFRFVRIGWEVSLHDFTVRWLPFAKGGSFSRFYADVYLVTNWASGGYELYAFNGIPFGGGGAPMRNPRFYFRPGLTWPLRTNGLSFRAMPAGSVFGHKGPAAFVDGDSTDDLLALGAIMNSRIFGYLVAVQLARTELAQSYEVGLIQQTPIPNLSNESTTMLARLARRAWSLKRSLDTGNETSHAFLLPSGVNAEVMGSNVDGASVERELAGIQAQIDDLTFSLYGISAEDRVSIEEPEASASDDLEVEAPDDADEGDDKTAVDGACDALLSWFVGVTLGRFDPRLATGERPIPPEPEPFDPLPSRSPGMYPEGEEPAERPDILVDDEGHPNDLTARALVVAERVNVEVLDDLRAWYGKEFFPFHIKMYSKSRRKAPIYWQLATPSASYSVWLYIHAFTPDTMVRVANDYVAPKLAIEEERLERLRAEAAEGSSAQRKAFDAQARFVDELRAFLEEVRRVAPLWNPDLDDGVILNFAPLWRLVPQHKAWQKEVKAKWDELCEGKYDWAHLAMHVWPERVVPKCADDRSFAIAHGLEDVFWFEDDKGKWHKRPEPTRPVAELVAERASPTVKAALQALLDAPTPSGGGRAGTKKASKGRRS